MKKSVKLLFVLALAAFAAVGCRNKNELESYLDLNASPDALALTRGVDFIPYSGS